MAKDARIRIMDFRATIQTIPDKDGTYQQFHVRRFTEEGEAGLVVDLLAEGGQVIEGMQPDFLAAVQEAIEMMKKLKLPEIDEQTS